MGCSYYDDLREIGIVYFIGASYRNRGYAVEAAKAYTAYFFNHYNLPRLIATIREENPASWKTAEKAGFRFIERKMYKDINDDNEELYRFYKIQNPNHRD